jgi:hypothetical protein
MNLEQALHEELDKIAANRLPGWEACFVKDPKIGQWLDTLDKRIRNAIRDEDRVRFERELHSIIKAWERINELVAEDYRAKNPDPEQWELRYVKYMKIQYMRFDSPLGEFYVVPRTPRRKPKAEHWYTVDEMLAMLHPPVVELIKFANSMPKRPESLSPPGPGEQVISIGPEGTKAHWGKS